MIRLDVSTTSVVVTCTECPHWSAFAWTRAEAHAAAADHEARCHGLADGPAHDALYAHRYRERRARG